MPLLVMPPAAERMVNCCAAETSPLMVGTTVPARSAAPETLTRSAAPPPTSTRKAPLAFWTKPPVSVVVIGGVPTPPGANLPKLVSRPVPPRSTIEPELNKASAKLSKVLTPAPSATLPVTVPEFRMWSFPVLLTIARPLRLERLALDPIVSRLTVPPDMSTPAPAPPCTAPLSIAMSILPWPTAPKDCATIPEKPAVMLPLLLIVTSAATPLANEVARIPVSCALMLPLLATKAVPAFPLLATDRARMPPPAAAEILPALSTRTGPVFPLIAKDEILMPN